MRHAKRAKLTTADINSALRARNVEKLYGFASTAPLHFKHVPSAHAQSLFYVEDEELDFEDVINAPLPKVPADTCFTAHWLGIEGVQPAIPQNPAPIGMSLMACVSTRSVCAQLKRHPNNYIFTPSPLYRKQD